MLDVEAIIRTLEVRPNGQVLEGEAPDLFAGRTLFGGFLLGQAVHATGSQVPLERRLHSIHAYFLRPAVPGHTLTHLVSTLRDGRAYSVRRVDVRQQGRTVLELAASYTTEPLGDALPPLDLADPETQAATPTWGPWEAIRLPVDGPVTSRAWLRTAVRLPDDARLHEAVLAMLTDLTASGGHPVPGATSRGFVSIDHAAWFQRPLRGDEWTYFGVETVTRTGRQAVIRGTLAGPDRRPAASMAQEIILPTS